MWDKILTVRVTQWTLAVFDARTIEDTKQCVEGVLFTLAQPAWPSVNKQHSTSGRTLSHTLLNKTVFFTQKGSAFQGNGIRDRLESRFEHPT